MVMMGLNYEIGRYYKYPDGDRFKLKEVIGYIFIFECGHRCTDTVFKDLIDCNTRIQVYRNNQLKLFIG